MTRESGIIVASDEARRKRFNEYMQDELQLLGKIRPGDDDKLPDLDYVPTTPEDEVAAGGEQDGEVPQQVGEEGQHGEADDGSEEHYPPPSDAADSDCRGPFGDSHVPTVFELGDFTPEEELEIMYGNREEREAMFREIDMYDEQRRQREQQGEEGREDVEMADADLPEASTTPTSLVGPSFFNNMLAELRDGVEPHARIVIEAAMEASTLAVNTDGDDLEVMMRIVRDTATEAFEDNRTPRQRLRIWRNRFRDRLEGLTGAEMRERSRSRTSRARRTATQRSPTEEPDEAEPESEEKEEEQEEEEEEEEEEKKTKWKRKRRRRRNRTATAGAVQADFNGWSQWSRTLADNPPRGQLVDMYIDSYKKVENKFWWVLRSQQW